MAFKSIEKKAPNKEAKNKTQELAAAKKALEKFFKDNNLDPTKDYSKDKKYGKEFKRLQEKLQKERDKVAAKFPETDGKKMKNLEKQANAIVKKEEKKKSAGGRQATKYTYPLVDGKEMTPDQKKKYRMEQRKAAKAKEAAPAPEKTVKAKEEAKPAKAKKKDKKEGKKAKKVED